MGLQSLCVSYSEWLALLLGPCRKELPHLLPAMCLLTSARIQSLQVGYESLLTSTQASSTIQIETLLLILHFLSQHSLWLLLEGCTDDFHCTNQGQSRLIDGVDDAREMCNTRKAFSLLGDCCMLHSKATQQASHSLLHYKVTKCACVHLLFDLFSFIVGINESVQMALYQILAAILHLSNVEVKDQSGDRSSILVKKK